MTLVPTHPQIIDYGRSIGQFWTAAHRCSSARYTMRKLMSSTPSAVILLVQPCDDGRDMYVEFLRHHGFAVIGVSDAWDALIVAPNVDVIVTGILLASSIDGHELIARLRNDERTNQTPIIVLTACAWTTERERAERAGCDAFLEKPCLPSELLRHVRQVLASSKVRRVRGAPVKAELINEPVEALGAAHRPTGLKRLG